MKDLNKVKEGKDWAVFLPAVSGFYVHTLCNYINKPETFPPNRLPKLFEYGLEGLDFLRTDDKAYFKYDSVLYSAGHACLDLQKGKTKEAMLLSRDKQKTTLVSDSGGFQIGKGVIKFDWANFFEKPGDLGYKGDADKVRMNILRWQEELSDWSMTMDIPPWAASQTERTGLRNFDECLNATLHNLDFYEKHREEGKTKFLNVLQGTNWPEIQKWYDTVKDYPFEGWAFGSETKTNIVFTLRLLIMMRDEGYLEGKDWLHFLGTSKLNRSCMFTSLCQILREDNPNVNISFDCASPFLAVANGLSYTTPVHTPDRWTYLMEKFPDHKMLKGSTLNFPFESEIGDRLKMGDVCWYGEADKNKIGKIGKTSWDVFSYILIMAHSLYSHINAVQVANSLYELETTIHKPNIRSWFLPDKRSKGKSLSKWVPMELLYFNSFVKELFKSNKPMSMINENIEFLNYIVDKRDTFTTNPLFNNLFNEEKVELDGDEDISDEEVQDKLDEFESKFETNAVGEMA